MNSRKGFTLLELVITIAVSAIVMGSTFQLLTNIYNSYKEIRDINSVDEKVSIASLQIVKYLEERVAGSEIESNGSDFFTFVEPRHGVQLSGTTSFQWISKAFDSYGGVWSNDHNALIPTWSGFLDLSLEHNRTQLYFDESNITGAEEIIASLSSHEVNISNSTQSSSPAIFFKGALGASRTGFGWTKSILGEDVNISQFAYLGEFNESNYTALGEFNDTVQDMYVYEQYLLSWTAYGLKFEESESKLYLYYNYRPWNGETMESNGTEILLLDNVTEFIFLSGDVAGASFKIRLCASSDDNETIFCRDSMIF